MQLTNKIFTVTTPVMRSEKKAICMRREMTFDVSRLLSVNNRLELIVNECLPSSMINNLGTLCLLVAGGV